MKPVLLLTTACYLVSGCGGTELDSETPWARVEDHEIREVDVLRAADRHLRTLEARFADEREAILDRTLHQLLEEAIRDEYSQKLGVDANGTKTGSLGVDEMARGLAISVFRQRRRNPVSLGHLPPMDERDGILKIVVFSDFECPFCSSLAQVMREASRVHDDIQIYYRHFPLEVHSSATLAAIAAECAFEQGRFWESHDYLFANQSRLRSAVDQLPETLRLDMQRYQECLRSPAAIERVESDIAAGLRLSVTATPTLFINGRRQVGLGDPGRLSRLLAEERSLLGVDGTNPGAGASE